MVERVWWALARGLLRAPVVLAGGMGPVIGRWQAQQEGWQEGSAAHVVDVLICFWFVVGCIP